MPLRPSHLVRPPPIRPPLLQLRFRRAASNFRDRRRSAPKQAPFGGPSSSRGRWHSQLGFRVGVGLGVASLGFIVWNLEMVPVSGRMRFNCVPASVELQAGELMYKHIMQEYKARILPKTHPYSAMVDRVMERLVAKLDGEDWEAVVIHDETVNAFVVPGGKVFVFSGLIPICENESGLAAILGHELAHNIAHHVGENLSIRWALSSLASVIALYFELPRSLINQLLDIGYARPGSRKQESEADFIGLLLMADACYNPEDAVGVQTRMMKAANDLGDVTPQFLSTHPSGENRAKKMAEWLPTAREVRAASGCGDVMEHVDGFNRAFKTQTQTQTQAQARAQTDDDGFW